MANQTQRYENASHGNFVMIAECALWIANRHDASDDREGNEKWREKNQEI